MGLRTETDIGISETSLRKWIEKCLRDETEN